MSTPAATEWTWQDQECRWWWWQYDTDCWVLRYRWNGGVVDGINYTRDVLAPSYMVTVKDAEAISDPARMRCDKPPTEAELDLWVRNSMRTDLY